MSDKPRIPPVAADECAGGRCYVANDAVMLCRWHEEQQREDATPPIPPVGSLGEAIRTCRRTSPPFWVGTPGTRGYHHERLFCTLMLHDDDSHLCDEGDSLSSWRGQEWTLLRVAKPTPSAPCPTCIGRGVTNTGIGCPTCHNASRSEVPNV